MGLYKVVFSSLRRVLLAAVVGVVAGQAAATPAPLVPEVYSPNAAVIFPLISVLVTGANGQQMVAICISHGDPDDYFGLDTSTTALPAAKVLAPAPTVVHIKALGGGVGVAHYISVCDTEALKAGSVAELIGAMHKRYPDLGEVSSLEFCAKFATGEMKG